MGFAVLTVWLLLVGCYLVRQWWVSELAQVHAGVDEPVQGALPTAPASIPVSGSTSHHAPVAGVLRVASVAAR